MITLSKPALSDHDVPKRVKSSFSRLSSWIQTILFTPVCLDDDVLNQRYSGSGKEDDPFVIDYLLNDRQDAMNFSKSRKWIIALFQAMSFFAVTFSSSVYSSGIPEVMHRFQVSAEVAILGVSLYVLGFALGPLLWAPMSEVYGRKPTFMISYAVYIAFSVAAPCAGNITTLLVLRFFASAFGSSAQTNPGAMIVDMFKREERGLITSLFAASPFLGPAIGPVVGGFVAETVGWRWVLGVNAILSGVVWIVTILFITETYAPVILQSRAKALSQTTGKVYVSHLDAGKPPRTLSKGLSVAFTRPWILMFREPIVFVTGLYISIVYATLYMFFAGIPIVFRGTRGWSQGLAGLPFIGIATGVCLAVGAVSADNKSYARLAMTAAKERRSIPPEARLRTAMIGSIVLPIGLFLFAWTTYPSIHWIVPIIGTTIFSCGLVMVFISLIGYLIDSYTVFAASVLAANTVLRSFFATAFPLFTTQMYAGIGDQWASSIPAFLVVGCLPFPFFFYKYGPQIRSRCKYAAEAAKISEMMHRRHIVVNECERVRSEKNAESEVGEVV